MATAQQSVGSLGQDVVATQGGFQVTLQDIDAAAQKVPERDRAGFFDSPKRIESVITSILLQRQLAAEARKEHLDQSPLNQKRVQLAIDDTLAAIQLERYKASLKIPNFDQLAAEYYASHKDEFLQPSTITVEHVLVSDKTRSDAEAKARIGEVELKAKQNPGEFEKLVDEYSDDPSKTENNGKVEDATSKKMAPPFAAAADKLKNPGEISPVVKTQFGYHVLKLIKRTEASTLPYEEVRARIAATLKQNFIDQAMNQYTGDLRGKPLDANPDLVASLRTRYAKAADGSASSGTPETAH